MNKQRRKDIAKEGEDLAKVISMVEDLIPNLENLRDEEQEYLDAMPENMQDGDKGEVAREAVSKLEEAIEALQEMVDTDPVSALQEAQS